MTENITVAGGHLDLAVSITMPSAAAQGMAQDKNPTGVLVAKVGAALAEALEELEVAEYTYSITPTTTGTIVVNVTADA